MTIIEKAKIDSEIRNGLIEKYTPFILKVTAEFTNRYIIPGDDEEYSIGLLAFNEAIDNFDSTKGISFFAFARNVIRRRLTDYYRRNRYREKEIPLMDSEQCFAALEYNLSVEKFGDEVRQVERRNEILDYKRELEYFGISFSKLVKASPKKRDARKRMIDIARVIAQDQRLTEYLMKTKLLPLKELELRTSLSRKTLERNRKYIIALVLILKGDYSYLKEYISGGK